MDHVSGRGGEKTAVKTRRRRTITRGPGNRIRRKTNGKTGNAGEPAPALCAYPDRNKNATRNSGARKKAQHSSNECETCWKHRVAEQVSGDKRCNFSIVSILLCGQLLQSKFRVISDATESPGYSRDGRCTAAEQVSGDKRCNER